MLTNDQGYDHAIQRQRLRKNEHDEHADEQLVLIFRSAHFLSGGLLAFGDGGVTLLLRLRREQGDLRCTVPNGPDAVIANNSNAKAGSQTGNAAAQSGAQMRQSSVGGVHVLAAVGWLCYRLRDDDADDQSIDADHTRHDDRDDVLHDGAGVSDASVHDANARLPRSYGTSPVAQAHCGGDSHVSQT
eukprot:CAMPEP_0119548072 /NCGR_PEP_ID=MMETSP1352-20130426/2081_1 /TAXON_ID=265584 /ORGANISM="Stauroneis constricta, Strain CCMP1120" /LENGTH=186 /DNA_ID=CAMNT_0007593241 /DNA_START=145 /DNA_END=705 /DNA_ORIENTATION=+